jgi:hypothetical protein
VQHTDLMSYAEFIYVALCIGVIECKKIED